MSASRVPNPEKSGLAYWMGRVLDKHSKLEDHLQDDVVHDVRVALRRCTVIAHQLGPMDAHRDWKIVRKSGRNLFRQLGELRDTQALIELIQRLAEPDDETTKVVLDSWRSQLDQARAAAKDSVRDFDRKDWRSAMKSLSGRFRHIAADRRACESLMYGMWQRVRDAHRKAQKSRSRRAYHHLRIELKKFRYGVENFLPSIYPLWADDLKQAQDLLGEVHDLDLLSQWIARKRKIPAAARESWVKKIDVERASRLAKYKHMMTGQTSRLAMWREALPADRELRTAGMAQFSEWAYFSGVDVTRAYRIARLAVQLYEGIARCKLVSHSLTAERRSILQAAALLEEIGRSRKSKSHQKETYRMIRRFDPPAGWTGKDMEWMALVARFHRGALPRPDHKLLKKYEPSVQQPLLLLAAILRFANAFHAKSYRSIRRLEVESSAGVIIVRAHGITQTDALTPKLAEARRLLEFACQHPIRVLGPSDQIAAPRIVAPIERSDAA